MKPVEAAFEQLRRANPVPNPAALRRELRRDADSVQRSIPMKKTLTTDTPLPTPTRRRPKWTSGLVAAAVVLVLGVATVVMTTDGSPFASTEPTPVEIAEAYLEARNDYDAERARELVSEDFRTSEYPGFTAETMELAFQQHEAYGFHYSNIECNQQAETAERVSVRCDFLWDTHLQSVGNHPPTPAGITVLVDEGLITLISRGSQPFDTWWNPWLTFLRSEHPEFADVVDRALTLDPDTVSQLVEEMPRYLNLYENWLNNQGN